MGGGERGGEGGEGGQAVTGWEYAMVLPGNQAQPHVQLEPPCPLRKRMGGGVGGGERGGRGVLPTSMAAYLFVELPMSLDLVPNRPSASSKHSTASVARASWNRASMFLGVSPTHLDTSPAQLTICTPLSTVGSPWMTPYSPP